MAPDWQTFSAEEKARFIDIVKGMSFGVSGAHRAMGAFREAHGLTMDDTNALIREPEVQAAVKRPSS